MQSKQNKSDTDVMKNAAHFGGWKTAPPLRLIELKIYFGG